MIVVLDDPQSEEHYGGQVAAPVFREIARRALRDARRPAAAARPASSTAGLRKEGRR